MRSGLVLVGLVALTGCEALYGSFGEPNPTNCLVNPDLCSQMESCNPATKRCVAVTAESPVFVTDCTAKALIDAIKQANFINQEKFTPIPLSVSLTKDCTYNLLQADNQWFGPNGLPPISSPLTIEGNGATIARDGAGPTFRLFYVPGSIIPADPAPPGQPDPAQPDPQRRLCSGR